MNFSSILTEIEKLDPEVYERTSGRRSVIKAWARRATLATLPLALGSLFNRAYGQTGTKTIADILNFALTLEYLEARFYKSGLLASTPNTAEPLIPSVTGLEQPAFTLIQKHEQTHVNFLTTTIQAMGKIPVSEPKFDFTGGKGAFNGPFTAVFDDYGTFLAVAQTFEDTGVRAYKGQATALKSENDILTAALRIHAVEARHAAHIRIMRALPESASPLSDNLTIKPWISLGESGINSPDVQASYDGEQNTSQANTEITNINGFNISARQASESFDEPLTMQQVMDIVTNFIVP